MKFIRTYKCNHCGESQDLECEADNHVLWRLCRNCVVRRIGIPAGPASSAKWESRVRSGNAVLTHHSESRAGYVSFAGTAQPFLPKCSGEQSIK